MDFALLSSCSKTQFSWMSPHQWHFFSKQMNGLKMPNLGSVRVRPWFLVVWQSLPTTWRQCMHNFVFCACPSLLRLLEKQSRFCTNEFFCKSIAVDGSFFCTKPSISQSWQKLCAQIFFQKWMDCSLEILGKRQFQHTPSQNQMGWTQLPGVWFCWHRAPTRPHSLCQNGIGFVLGHFADVMLIRDNKKKKWIFSLVTIHCQKRARENDGMFSRWIGSNRIPFWTIAAKSTKRWKRRGRPWEVFDATSWLSPGSCYFSYSLSQRPCNQHKLLNPNACL